MSSTPPAPGSYGQLDATFQAAGAEAGVRQLVGTFYDLMSSRREFERLRAMHPTELQLSRDKLARFLCGWMGGPRTYSAHYGPISIPGAHRHLIVTALERDQWLDCMAMALAVQNYPEALQTYLLEQLRVPAERIRALSEQSHQTGGADSGS